MKKWVKVAEDRRNGKACVKWQLLDAVWDSEVKRWISDTR